MAHSFIINLRPGKFHYFITFENLKENDSGNYTCNCENSEANTLDIVNIVVQKKKAEIISPTIQIRPSGEQKVEKGSTIDIECIVNEGQPIPILEWKRVDGEQLSSRISFWRTSEYSLHMILNNTESDDFGAYECVATNSAGQIKKLVKIIECKHLSLFQNFNYVKKTNKLIKKRSSRNLSNRYSRTIW